MHIQAVYFNSKDNLLCSFPSLESYSTDHAQECRLFEIILPNTVLNFFTLVLDYTAHTTLSLILLECKGCMCVELIYFTEIYV